MMIPSSVSFFLRLIGILYIIFTWFDIATNYISDSFLQQTNKPISSFNMTELDPSNQKKKNQTCHRKCSLFYQKVSIDHTPLEWLYCQNDEKSSILGNNQTYLDLLNRLSKQANDCQQYNRITQLSNFTNGIQLRHGGCYLNYSHSIYQCYDVMISSKHFRMIKSTIKPSVFSKMKILANQYFLDVIFTPQTREKIYSVLQFFRISKDSSLIFLVLLFIYIYFYDVVAMVKGMKMFEKLFPDQKDQNNNQPRENGDLDHVQIQKGFKLIEFIEQQFQKNTNSGLNFKIVKTISKIISFLWTSQHKKIKLMTFPSGMGISRSIQSQIRNNRIYYYQFAILFDLKQSYPQVAGTNQDTVQLLDSLLYALQHENKRFMKNIIRTHLNGLYFYCKDWFMGILNLEGKYLVLIIINTLLIEMKVEKIIIVWIIQVMAFMYYFWQEVYSFIEMLCWKIIYQMKIFFFRNKKMGAKKAIIINHFQKLEDQDQDYKDKLIKKCLKIQKKQKYDIILISNKRQFTTKLKQIKSFAKQFPFKQMSKCPHRLPNKQILQILKDRVLGNFVKIAQLTRLFTQNIEVMMTTFRTLNIDRKYQITKDQTKIDQYEAIQKIFQDMKKQLESVKETTQKIISNNHIQEKILRQIITVIKSKNINLQDQQYGLFIKAFIQQIDIISLNPETKKQQFQQFLVRLFLSIDEPFDYKDKKQIQQWQQIKQKKQGVKSLRDKGIIAGNNFSSITFAIAIYQKYNNIQSIKLCGNWKQNLKTKLQQQGPFKKYLTEFYNYISSKSIKEIIFFWQKNQEAKIQKQGRFRKYLKPFLCVIVTIIVLSAVFIQFKSQIQIILQK